MKSKKEFNYYKISTFILIGLILVLGLVYLLNSYMNYKYEKGIEYGKNVAIDSILNFILKEGSVTIFTNQGNFTLVPSQFAQYQKEKTILDIMNLVNENGYVSLYNNESEMILIEYRDSNQNLTN